MLACVRRPAGSTCRASPFSQALAAWRTASFLAGLLVLMTALLRGSIPIPMTCCRSMVQHILLILAAPALLLWGAPVRLALSAAPRRGRRAIGAVLRQRWVELLTRPACGFALFTIVMLGTHLTGLYEAGAAQTRRSTLSSTPPTSGRASLFLLPLLAADPVPASAGRDRKVLLADGRDDRACSIPAALFIVRRTRALPLLPRPRPGAA